MNRLSRLSEILALCLFPALAIAKSAATYNYAEALQKSILFFEAQRSGPVPNWNRLEWKGPSALGDGLDVGLDLTGGWYDAGDHVKFHFPMTGSATLLALGALEYAEGYRKSGQWAHLLNNLRWVADYLVKCHPQPNVLFGQVGNGDDDHKWWGPAEVMTMARPAAKLDASNPGSDLAGETAAALASISMVFKSSDANYANLLLQHAKQIYEFADKYRGKYSDAIPGAKSFYNSWSGFEDELVWGAIWLYQATQDNAYLVKAEAAYASLGTEPQTTTRSYKWTHAWDNKAFGSYVLLAKLTGKAVYKQDAERWLDFWTTGVDGQKVTTTPGGLAWLDTWGSLRYSMNTSLFAFLYGDKVASGAKQKTYRDFAIRQIHYVLGDNPAKRSYVVGFGLNPPTKPHHRSAHGSWADKMDTPAESRHILYGALVGGPDKEDKYTDSRQDYVMNEVATDYNAAFTGVLARMVQEFGGEPLANFPPKEVHDTEYAVLAKLNTTGTHFTEISARLLNRTAWPARKGQQLRIRYFVNLSEVFAAGYTLDDVKLTMGYNQEQSAKSATILPAVPAQNLFMVEIDFDGANIYPGGQSQHSKEVQFRIGLPAEAKAGSWNPDNDPSYAALAAGGTEPKINPSISVYEYGHVVFGLEPAGTSLFRGSNHRAAIHRLGLGFGDLSFPWKDGKSNRIEYRSLQGRAVRLPDR
jgi:endoglucanase